MGGWHAIAAEMMSQELVVIFLFGILQSWGIDLCTLGLKKKENNQRRLFAKAKLQVDALFKQNVRSCWCVEARFQFWIWAVGQLATAIFSPTGFIWAMWLKPLNFHPFLLPFLPLFLLSFSCFFFSFSSSFSWFLSYLLSPPSLFWPPDIPPSSLASCSIEQSGHQCKITLKRSSVSSTWASKLANVLIALSGFCTTTYQNACFFLQKVYRGGGGGVIHYPTQPHIQIYTSILHEDLGMSTGKAPNVPLFWRPPKLFVPRPTFQSSILKLQNSFTQSSLAGQVLSTCPQEYPQQHTDWSQAY